MKLFLTLVALAYAGLCLLGWSICAIAEETDMLSGEFGHDPIDGQERK